MDAAPVGRMHDDEVDITIDMAATLIAAQHPELADRPLAFVADSVLFRLGDDLCVRLPRTPRSAGNIAKELEWLPRLAPQLATPIPEPIAAGAPTSDHPFAWSIHRWIPGTPLHRARTAVDEVDLAERLATFVVELRRVDPTGGPPTGRAPLPDLDDVTRWSIAHLEPGDGLDPAVVTTAWDACLRAPPRGGTTVWRHADLLPHNLLVDDDGTLAAVIDFGSAGIGDPASDTTPAWSAFGPRARVVYRDLTGFDDPTWDRGRALALHQALSIVTYYRDTHPTFAASARQTVHRVVEDLGL